MPSFVSEITSHVDSVQKDAQLAGTLLDNRQNGSRGRPGYFFLTDLTNPQQAYWDHLGESPEYTDEMRELFAHGNRMESVARKAFSRVDGISGQEAVVDGAEGGISGIRGRIDFRYGESIVEFKTSTHAIEDPGDVWEKAPQTIEQLLFYAALWTNDASEHHLVFHLGNGPESVRVFTATLNNAGQVWNQLKSRKDNLEYSLEEGKPEIAKRCRYHGGACHIKEAGLCDCEDLDQPNTEPLQDATSVERNGELEAEVVDAFRAVDEETEAVSAWDLETPRQWLGRQIGEREKGNWIPQDSWAYDALTAADLLPGEFDDVFIPNITDPIEFYSPGMMIKRSRTTGAGEETRWVPAIHKVKDDPHPPTPKQLRNQIMQLGCACALAESATGNLIVELPNSAADLVTYRVVFDDLNGIKSKIENQLEAMEEALELERPDSISQCPEWLHSKCEGSCFCK